MLILIKLSMDYLNQLLIWQLELLEVLLNLVEGCLVKQISVTPCLRQEAMLI